ncbi:HIT family protein [Halorientalis marina]|uniref:HIT family protein n=1 Tax=Halorientalis marina TaxID=2931976 RepID=UPI001FF6D62B|nr:HIT family protein [Halorientalis marina]
MAEDCLFCAIVDGDAPASVVDETDDLLAFMDLNPITEGHALVIPKEHAAGLTPLDPEIGGRMFEEAMAVAGAMRDSDLDPDGIDLFLADGEAAGQEVFHVHLHVIPRYEGDGVVLPVGEGPADREELDALAVDLADAL